MKRNLKTLLEKMVEEKVTALDLEDLADIAAERAVKEALENWASDEELKQFMLEAMAETLRCSLSDDEISETVSAALSLAAEDAVGGWLL